MSKIDPEVLYLILTKVAGAQTFYNYDPAQAAPGQKPGTITLARLGEVYERVTGHSPGNRTAWTRPLNELNGFLGHCGLPPLGAVVVIDAPAPSGEKEPENLGKVRATRWPAFRDLKNLYRKKG